MIFVFVWFTWPSIIISRSIHVAANSLISFFLIGWVIFLCLCVCVCVCTWAYILHFCYSFICWWKLMLLPCLSRSNQFCDEHWGACTFWITFFLVSFCYDFSKKNLIEFIFFTINTLFLFYFIFPNYFY